MKKKMIALLAGALLTVAMAGNALAAFENFDLIRIAYQTTGGTAEVATDLGSLASLTAGGAINSTSFVQGGTAGTAGSLFGNTALSNIQVLYVAYNTNDITGSAPAYFSAGAVAPTIINNAQWQNATSNLQAYYTGLSMANGNATQVVGVQSAPNSYASLYGNGGGTNSDGSLGLLIDPSTATVEANLGAGAATQHLWYIADPTNPTFVDLGTLVTGTNGVTTFSSAAAPAATPIPPALLLMGSGLLGMVGLRRKKA